MLADLFRRSPESRAVSYQNVWGTGGDVTSERADELAMSAVIGCVGLRARYLSQLPFDAYQVGPDGLPVAVQNPFIAAPSGKVVRSVWIQQMSISRDIWGNAVGAITGVDRLGFPTGVEWLNPSTVVLDESSGRLVVKVNGKVFDGAGVVIVPSVVLPGSCVGISLLRRSGLVNLAKRAQDFGSDWFQNGAVPSSIIKVDREIDEDEATVIRDRVASSWRKRRPAVIGSGLTVEHVKIDANESQFLETMRHVQVDICQIFGVPPEKIGVAAAGSSVTYSNREQRTQDMLVDSINADLVVIQEHLGQLTPRPQFVRFNTGALVRSDLTTRYAAHAVALAAGFLTVDEVRRLEDLSPLPQAIDTASPRDIAELIQKIYLGVGKVLTADEARFIANRAGANLDISKPFDATPDPPPSIPSSTGSTP